MYRHDVMKRTSITALSYLILYRYRAHKKDDSFLVYMIMWFDEFKQNIISYYAVRTRSTAYMKLLE